MDGEGYALWDVPHVRLAADYTPFEGTPESRNPGTSTAYRDDDFFAQEGPLLSCTAKVSTDVFFCLALLADDRVKVFVVAATLQV